MKTLMPAMDSETDVDDAIGDPSRDSDNETAEALAARNLTDMEAADMPLNMTASLGAVRRGFIRIADPDVTDAGIDAPEQRHGGRLDQGGFLGRPSGWNR